ncbi:MAG: hypothetical protein L0Z62_12040 [Gemmataceae bacterium]|nr:hypothetical protein [Gemmataceae bacterium]
MSQDTRAELLQALGEIGRRFPNWRFGQLVENVAGWADVSAWDVSDEQLLAAARSYLEPSATFSSTAGQKESSG